MRYKTWEDIPGGELVRGPRGFHIKPSLNYPGSREADLSLFTTNIEARLGWIATNLTSWKGPFERVGEDFFATLGL